MPIVDIELVCDSISETNSVSARAIADALGQVFGSPPGRTWIRLNFRSSSSYAENGVDVSPSELPAFVTVLKAHTPNGSALVAEVAAVTEAVARCINRSTERVHVQYSPSAAGRQAFGGHLVE